MRGLPVLLTVAACHSTPPAVRVSDPSTPPFGCLFQKGRRWTLDVRGSAPVTCTVTDFKLVADANVSRLDCGALLVSGTWVATSAGLYHPYLPVDEPDELTLLGEDDLLLRGQPSDREHEHVLEGGARSTIEAFAFGSSWCVREATSAGPETRRWTLCFDGENITGGGEELWSGDERSMTYFGVVPPPSGSSD